MVIQDETYQTIPVKCLISLTWCLCLCSKYVFIAFGPLFLLACPQSFFKYLFIEKQLSSIPRSVESTFEPPHDKTNKMACAPSEDSDQPGHPPSLIRVFACAQLVAKEPSFLHVDSEDSDQTKRMPRLNWVFAGRTCHYVGFVVRRLICLFNAL